MAMIVLARKAPAVKQVEKRLVTHAYFNSILRLPLGASFFQNIAGNAKIRSPRSRRMLELNGGTRSPSARFRRVKVIMPAG